MTEHTLDVNGTRYQLNEEFREAVQERAKREYADNPRFSCWWKVEDGDSILVIETAGKNVPWDRLDHLEMKMNPQGPELEDPEVEPDDTEDIDSGNGMVEQDPPENPSTRDVNFGRTHFKLTPHRYEEVPSPGGDDPDKVPTEPEEVDGEMVVMWVPRHPDVDVSWSAGDAMLPVDSWVEWNVQEKADQPRPAKDKINSHDAFESLCRIHDCEVVAEAQPSNNISGEVSGSVERKGEEAFENGRRGGNNWNM